MANKGSGKGKPSKDNKGKSKKVESKRWEKYPTKANENEYKTLRGINISNVKKLN